MLLSAIPSSRARPLLTVLTRAIAAKAKPPSGSTSPKSTSSSSSSSKETSSKKSIKQRSPPTKSTPSSADGGKKKKKSPTATVTKKKGLKEAVGVIGLGNMGSVMARNILSAGYPLVVYDLQSTNMDSLVAKGAMAARSVEELGDKVKTVLTMLPNDEAILRVAGQAHQNLGHVLGPGHLHISCSTISPQTSRTLATLHHSMGATYISAPVFARPDGIAMKKAFFVCGGAKKDIKRATPILLSTGAKVFDFGRDVGTGNVVKLVGNYLIASTIESIGEALALAEAQGVDRGQVITMLTSTIFDCLIYKGYGTRIAQRDHKPGGFSLDLGLKDLTLLRHTAHESGVPMPFVSTLHDRLLAAKQQGKGHLDWSALALLVAEESGLLKHPPE